MQMHKSFILDSALTKESTHTILFPWIYQAIDNTKEFLILFYPHTQKRHLIICSSAEERQVPNHSCHFAEWLGVFVYLCAFLLGRGVRMVTLSQLLLTGVNTLSTSLYTVSTSLLSVWWQQKWQDDDCHPQSFSLVFILRQNSLWASQAHLISSWAPVLLHFLCRHTRIAMN